MKKVGLCACCNGNNSGTMLQAYASLYAIRSLGYDCEIIKYKKKYTPTFILKQILRLFNSLAVKGFFKKIKKKLDMHLHSSYLRGTKQRNKMFKKFREKYFHNSTTEYFGYKALCDGSKKYSAVVVGSDQLWLPSGLPTNFYNLVFVDDSVTKISYATSFGVSKIPFYQKKRTKHFLERFDAISVRETSGKNIITSLTDKNVEVVVDPTLLLTIDQWAAEIPDKKVIEGNYIFCYFLGKNKECRTAANELKQKTGLKIVTLRHHDEFIPFDEFFGDEAPYDISPCEFINLIRHAEYILTDSFHGTVFSIIHHKQFVTFYRSKVGSIHSRNTRIDSLFSILGLGSRIYQNTDILEEISKGINYEDIEKSLTEVRKHSHSFLEYSLELGKQI